MDRPWKQETLGWLKKQAEFHCVIRSHCFKLKTWFHMARIWVGLMHVWWYRLWNRIIFFRFQPTWKVLCTKGSLSYSPSQALKPNMVQLSDMAGAHLSSPTAAAATGGKCSLLPRKPPAATIPMHCCGRLLLGLGCYTIILFSTSYCWVPWSSLQSSFPVWPYPRTPMQFGCTLTRQKRAWPEHLGLMLSFAFLWCQLPEKQRSKILFFFSTFVWPYPYTAFPLSKHLSTVP